MSTLLVSLVTGRPVNQLEQWFETPGGKQGIAQRLSDFVERILSGNESAEGTDAPPSISMSIQENAVQASGSYVFDTVVATDAFAINGVSFTAVASGATGNQFNVGANDLETAENAAAAVNASVTSLVAGYVTASAADVSGDATLTITAVPYGIAGNAFTITSADATITPSGARLTGGAADADAQTLNF